MSKEVMDLLLKAEGAVCFAQSGVNTGIDVLGDVEYAIETLNKVKELLKADQKGDAQ